MYQQESKISLCEMVEMFATEREHKRDVRRIKKEGFAVGTV